MHKKIKKGVSNFGVLTQIWDIGTSLKIQSNRFFNLYKEKVFICWDCSDSCGVIPLKKPILEIFGVMAGV